MADHLFTLPEKPQKQLRIQYIGPAYDRGDWFLYPQRHGFHRALLSETLEIPLPPESSKHMECWLYFGVLYAIFEEDLDENTFRYHENGARYITTMSLEFHMGATQKKQTQWVLRRHNFVDDILNMPVLNLLIKKSVTYVNNPSNQQLVRPQMMFAIKVLLASLTYIVARVVKDRSFEELKEDAMLFRSNWADAEMESLGWCPSEVRRFFYMDYPLLVQAYLLQLQRPGLHRVTDHVTY